MATRTLLSWRIDGVDGAMELDAAKSRGFEAAAEVTELPVEEGSPITDHVRPTNPTVSIEGVISNTPIVVPSTQMGGVTRVVRSISLSGQGGAKATVLALSAAVDRRRVCDAILADLVERGASITLTTPTRIVENLAITRYKVDESAETGKSLAFVMEFKRLRIAVTARAPVPAVRRLQVPPQRATQPADNRSFLARALDGGAPATAARERARGS